MSSVPLIRSTFDGRRDPAPRFGAVIAQLARILTWPARVTRARRELAKLSRLSDHELRDIGLSRHDIRGATALPLDEDPTRFLAAEVRQRHRAERARRR